MNYSYVPDHDPTLALTRLLFWILFALFIAALLLASGSLVVSGNSFTLDIGNLFITGTIGG